MLSSSSVVLEGKKKFLTVIIDFLSDDFDTSEQTSERAREGWRVHIFALKILIAFAFYTTFFLYVPTTRRKRRIYCCCRELRLCGCKATWIHKFRCPNDGARSQQPVSRNYFDDNFQGCRISFAHNLSRARSSKKSFMNEGIFVVRGNASFLC